MSYFAESAESLDVKNIAKKRITDKRTKEMVEMLDREDRKDMAYSSVPF
jgi:hypothetical protein